MEYRRIIYLFLKFLSARSERALTTLQQRQIEDFKTHLGKRVSPSTVNKGVKLLKAALNAAEKSRQLEFSPAEHVEFIHTEQESRRPFTGKELSALLTKAEADWRTMVLTAFYTGLRLRDCGRWELDGLRRWELDGLRDSPFLTLSTPRLKIRWFRPSLVGT